MSEGLRARVEALLTDITPGEWQRGRAGLADVIAWDGDDVRAVAHTVGYRDAEFIAAAPQLVRDLVADVTRLQDENARVYMDFVLWKDQSQADTARAEAADAALRDAQAHREEQHMRDIEAISAVVHEQWMETKRANGVTSRTLETGEELMVPYADLSESAKELDRGSVRAVLRAIDALAPDAAPGSTEMP